MKGEEAKRVLLSSSPSLPSEARFAMKSFPTSCFNYIYFTTLLF